MAVRTEREPTGQYRKRHGGLSDRARLSGYQRVRSTHNGTATFEGHALQTENGVEYWLARDLQHLLGYGKWDNFFSVISTAKTAGRMGGDAVSDHFANIGKMVGFGSGSQRKIDDVMLTRYAPYLIAQNGDARKQEIAFAQTYFAMQTRKAELIEQRLLETERVQVRQKLSATEKELSGVIFKQTGGNQNFALIRSKGDTALFDNNTQVMRASGRCRITNHWPILHQPSFSKPKTLLSR